MNYAASGVDLTQKIVAATPRTALVLSAGGLFGAYQAGAWKYLHETSFNPDLIVGASVGAINGWAIAGGCRGEELATLWLDESRSNVLKRARKPSFRTGFFDPAPLQNLTEEVFADYPSSEKFGLVTVELPFLRSRLFKGSTVTSRHLLASASIPLAMPSVSIAGCTFTDGGLLEDVPLWAAVEMGATRIVAVDAMHFDCPWWYRASVSPMGLLAPRVSSGMRSNIRLIRPSRPLGHYSEALEWSRDRIQDWIDLGYSDARRAVSEAY